MANTGLDQPFGLGEADLRHRLEEELEHAMKTEGGIPTAHALAHALARVLTEDHRAMSARLTDADVEIK
jgi:hypothetical protein